MSVADAAGYSAAIISTVCWVPQAIKTVRTQNTQAISIGSQALFTFSILLWIAYGALAPALPVLLCNVVALVPVGITLIIKINNRLHRGEH